jgi:hypothetical protein
VRPIGRRLPPDWLPGGVEDPMGRIRFAWLALAAILALAACQSVSEIDGVALTAEVDTEIEALAVATPFKGWYDWFVIEQVWPEDGDLTFGGRCATPSDYLIRAEGPGRLNHMGRITLTNDHCTQLATGTHDGVMTFVAPDGSSVVTTYTGYGIPEAEAYVFVTDFTIVGGTGRFAGATGGGLWNARLAYVDLPALIAGEIPMRQWMDGHIIYAPGKALGR